jgi:hypothetical protein
MARLRIAAAAATIAGFFAAFVAGAGLMAVRWGEDPYRATVPEGMYL